MRYTNGSSALLRISIELRVAVDSVLYERVPAWRHQVPSHDQHEHPHPQHQQQQHHQQASHQRQQQSEHTRMRTGRVSKVWISRCDSPCRLLRELLKFARHSSSLGALQKLCRSARLKSSARGCAVWMHPLRGGPEPSPLPYHEALRMVEGTDVPLRNISTGTRDIKYLSFPWVVTLLSSVLITTIVVDILGNLLVIVSVFRNRKLRKAGKYFSTYYLQALVEKYCLK
ncbi:hypothetical protein DNTS_009754 [Danionella cerebrum]|uniref:G-protein coupled receptors family 1 profile domain-containing protein n=1 Tax=Danionella cerebrum TaxID=2873325 RepID=A0A553RA30_9TELE|nr:hypothetical protein DNTS_009754 [Danionella translucida]